MRTEALDVSDNGVVVGTAYNSQGLRRAFRWTPETGLQDLGTLGGRESEALGISANGVVIVGRAEKANYDRVAFRWTSTTGMQTLSGLENGASKAFAVSADGGVIVGWYGNSPQTRAFRWSSAGGLLILPYPVGQPDSPYFEAFGVSADGNTVAGSIGDTPRVFRWTAQTGTLVLGTLGGAASEARDVSGNGSVIVGGSLNAQQQMRAFRWTAATGMQDIGALEAGQSFAYGVSGDGTVVVGISGNAAGLYQAFRWTPATGVQNLNIVYSSLLTPGSRLESALDISLNGRYIVGVGYNATTQRFEGFLLDTRREGDVDGNGCVDDADLLQVLFAFGGGSPAADVNGDGIVDDADLLIVLFNFGAGC
ncbi:MAG: hypothetical protein N2554_00630 [Fimbriimonadales bacterium]|nr:hypothetical protein [Fimbriimonadales bacterium]